MPRAVLDTNVLFSRVLHELIGRAATTGNLLELIWSDELVKETVRTLIEGKGLARENAELWVALMTDAFPAGRVDIERTPPELDLSALTSDDDDRHICALAIDEYPDVFREILLQQANAWGDRTVAELIDAIERTETRTFAAKARRLFGLKEAQPPTDTLNASP